MSFYSWLARPVTERGIRVFDRGEWTYSSYAQIARLTGASAARFRASGVGAGDAVAIVRPTSIEFVADFFGALLVGATPAPITPVTAVRNQQRYVEHVRRLTRLVGARAVATTAELAPFVEAAVDPKECVVVCDIPGDMDPPPADATLAETALVQFSSGSSGSPRAIRISMAAFVAQTDAVRSWLRAPVPDPVASWLPLHHDFGLGSLMLGMSSSADIWLMAPEAFVRSPEAWLGCFRPGQATLTASPNFGLAHTVKRCRRSALAGFDLSGLRGIVLGAERIDTRVLDAFLDLVTAYGASRDIFVPAYGLAESTVGVTGAPKQRGVRTFTVDTGSLALGTRVASAEPGAAGLVLVSCGSPLTGVGVRLLDEDGSPVGDDMLGEIEVSGTSLASSYLNADGTQTPLGDAIRTGDAGFLHDGELYVVGRLGDGVKELGRWVFAEDLEAVAAQVSPAPAHTVALTGALNGRNTGVVLVGADVEDAASGIGRAVREAAGGVRVLVYSCSSAAIRRTTSGKPMRRAMWTELTEETTRAVLRWDSDNVMPA